MIGSARISPPSLGQRLQALSGLVKILKRRLSPENIKAIVIKAIVIKAIVIDTRYRKYYTKYKYILSIILFPLYHGGRSVERSTDRSPW
jgi:hypothetical protein